MKGAAALLLVAAGALALPAEWLHNPRERTASGLRAWERGDQADAARAFDQALELGGDDPRFAFNAGTGHLGAGAPGAAMPLLERAAAAAGELRPDALYNLGNARLGAADAAGAVASYEACLRLAPDHAAAKHNLELALRRLQEQQDPQEPEEAPSGGGGEGGTPEQGEEGAQDPQPGEQPQQPEGGGEQRQQQGERSSRLPQFDPQEDMSADQAAALLEAVENLEREQRRAQAEEQRRRRARGDVEKDW